jgi:hypothetical protein
MQVSLAMTAFIHLPHLWMKLCLVALLLFWWFDCFHCFLHG